MLLASSLSSGVLLLLVVAAAWRAAEGVRGYGEDCGTSQLYEEDDGTLSLDLNGCQTFNVAESQLSVEDAVVLGRSLVAVGQLRELTIGGTTFAKATRAVALAAMTEQLQGSTFQVTDKLYAGLTDFGPQDAEVLGQLLLEHLTDVEWLDMRGTSFAAGGLEALIAALRQHENLKTIDFSQSFINLEHATLLGEYLASGAVEVATFRGCTLGDAGVKALLQALNPKQSKLVALDLNSNGITAVGAKTIGDAVANFETLDELALDNNPIGNDGLGNLADGIARRKEPIAGLILPNTDITAEGGAHFARLVTKVGILNLIDNDLLEDGGRALAAALAQPESAVTDILIANCKIGAAFADLVAATKTNTELGWIAVQANLINDDAINAFVDALEQGADIAYMNLDLNNITTVGAKAIAKAIRTSHTLNSLNLAGNRIDSAGVTAFIAALSHNPSIAELRMHDNPAEAHVLLQLDSLMAHRNGECGGDDEEETVVDALPPAASAAAAAASASSSEGAAAGNGGAGARVEL